MSELQPIIPNVKAKPVRTASVIQAVTKDGWVGPCSNQPPVAVVSNQGASPPLPIERLYSGW